MVIGTLITRYFQRTVLQRIGLAVGQLQVLVRETVFVDDQNPARLQSADVGDQRAGFITTKAFKLSPGVKMSLEANWT
jgi:hypothetical protein